MAAHGWAMEDPAEAAAEEPALLERAHAALTRIAGRAPLGWRTPTGTLTPRTLSLLAGMGYRYDSSYQDDDRPYVQLLAGGARLAEIPRNEVLDDSTYYGGAMPGDTLERAWAEEFAALAGEGEGLPCLTLSPRGDRGAGRASRVAVVDRFLARAFEAAVEDGSLPGLIALNQDFHAAFYALCGNAFLAELIGDLRARGLAGATGRWRLPRGLRDTAREHLDMVEAVAAADAARLRDLIRAHITAF